MELEGLSLEAERLQELLKLHNVPERRVTGIVVRFETSGDHYRHPARLELLLKKRMPTDAALDVVSSLYPKITTANGGKADNIGPKKPA